MLNNDEFKETVRNIRNSSVRLERRGEYWSDKDKEKLNKMFHDGTGITEMAVILQRTESAIMQQIEQQDLYCRKQNPSRQRNTVSPSQCLCAVCKADPATCPLADTCPRRQESA